MIEDYVSFEIAKLLKEKGFDEGCRSHYGTSGSLSYEKYEVEASGCEMHNAILAPTLQMAMKWLREKNDLHIMVDCVGKVNYDPIIQRFDGEDFEVEGTEVGTTKLIDGKYVNVRRGFKTYEKACEAAIKYCLEKLI